MRQTGGRRKDSIVGLVAARISVMALLCLTAASCTTMSDYSVSPHEYPGVRLYQVFCSSCHGLTGRGDGPVQPLLRAGVPDLTRISERHGGQFPVEDIRRIVDGRTAVAAHGTREMPVWGYEFYGNAPSDRIARDRAEKAVGRLVGYLQTLQPDHEDR